MVENKAKSGEDEPEVEAVSSADVTAPKAPLKAYEKPVLVSYGDVRDITLGPTNGEGESGNAVIFRVPQP